MVTTADAEPERSVDHPTTHLFARFEDMVHTRREAWARRHGRIPLVIPFSGYGSTEWTRVLCRVMLQKPEPVPSDPPTRSDRKRAKRRERLRGWRSFVSVPLNGAMVSITIDGTTTEVRADRGGVVDAVIPISLEAGWHVATLETPGGVAVEAPTQIIDPSVEFGIVSDVDDTVMVTALPRPFVAAWNTFVLDEHARIPTPGMAVLMERLVSANPGCPVIYLSTGAWNVAPTLTRFLSRNIYPAGALLLTDWGPTHDRWFRSGQEHKRDNLRRLAEEFPNIKWLLIGDDGQHDEDIYRRFAAERPGHVSAVAIRQLSTGEAVLAGGRSKPEKDIAPDVPWVYAPDGSGIVDQLDELGIV
ncbi:MULTISPECIES: phosphatase domain-containing protein [unclassified Leifsonia]|uniref:App1 family protein n=1 Tax=unclassified Leifsonia TaxID=2663824 RepID=UPI0009EC73E2